MLLIALQGLKKYAFLSLLFCHLLRNLSRVFLAKIYTICITLSLNNIQFYNGAKKHAFLSLLFCHLLRNLSRVFLAKIYTICITLSLNNIQFYNGAKKHTFLSLNISLYSIDKYFKLFSFIVEIF